MIIPNFHVKRCVWIFYYFFFLVDVVITLMTIRKVVAIINTQNSILFQKPSSLLPCCLRQCRRCKRHKHVHIYTYLSHIYTLNMYVEDGFVGLRISNVIERRFLYIEYRIHLSSSINILVDLLHPVSTVCTYNITVVILPAHRPSEKKSQTSQVRT